MKTRPTATMVSDGMEPSAREPDEDGDQSVLFNMLTRQSIREYAQGVQIHQMSTRSSTPAPPVHVPRVSHLRVWQREHVGVERCLVRVCECVCECFPQSREVKFKGTSRRAGSGGGRTSRPIVARLLLMQRAMEGRPSGCSEIR